jgi:hypothetical protein
VLRRTAVLLLTAVVLGAPHAALSPAHASLLNSLRRVVVRANEVLPVRIRLGPAGVVTQAQRDSVRRVRLAKLPKPAPLESLAGMTGSSYVRRTLELHWWIADSVSRDVRVHRRDPKGPWRFVGRTRADVRGQLSWRDSTVLRGQQVEYALELRTTRGICFVPLPAVSIPGDRPLRLVALTDPGGSSTLLLELPTSYPATIELFDVAGRRLGSIDVGGLTAGPHTVAVPRTLLPSAGLYFVRLQQAGVVSDAKLFVPQ